MQIGLGISSNVECRQGGIRLNVFYSLNAHDEQIPVKFDEVENSSEITE